MRNSPGESENDLHCPKELPILKEENAVARLITLLILGSAAYWLFKQLTEKLKRKTKTAEITQKKMVQCSYCGVHFPEEQSHLHNQKIFCSQAHLAQFSEEKKRDTDDKKDSGQTSHE